MSEFQILEVRKLADRSEGERIKAPVLQEQVLRNGETLLVHTGEWKLVNPDSPGIEHESWPLAGVTIIGDPPQFTTAGTRWADKGVNEGWIRRIGERAVPRPAGPAHAPWSTTPHVFMHADKLVIKDQVRGDVTYRVTRQPDKYFTEGEYQGQPVESYGDSDDHNLLSSEVFWFYTLELETSNG